jgi:hypothetical protein
VAAIDSVVDSVAGTSSVAVAAGVTVFSSVAGMAAVDSVFGGRRERSCDLSSPFYQLKKSLGFHLSEATRFARVSSQPQVMEEADLSLFESISRVDFSNFRHREFPVFAQ